MLDNNPHRETNFGARQAVGPDQLRRIVNAQQIHLSLAPTCEDMDMRG